MLSLGILEFTRHSTQVKHYILGIRPWRSWAQ